MKDVAENALAMTRPDQIQIEGWAEKRRKKQEQE